MLHHVAFLAAGPTPACRPELDGARPLHDTELLDMINPAPGARVLLIGPDAIGLLCELLRRGRLSAATVRLPDYPETGAADAAVTAPCIVSARDAHGAVAQARQALAPLGRFAMCLAADPSGMLVQAAYHALLSHGFSHIQMRSSVSQTLLKADLTAGQSRHGLFSNRNV